MVVVAVKDRQEVYSSVEAVPPNLRQKLLKSTAGDSAATILIADRAGQEAILGSLRARVARQQSRTAANTSAGHALVAWIRTWGEILLTGVIGLAVWLLATYR